MDGWSLDELTLSVFHISLHIQHHSSHVHAFRFSVLISMSWKGRKAKQSGEMRIHYAFRKKVLNLKSFIDFEMCLALKRTCYYTMVLKSDGHHWTQTHLQSPVLMSFNIFIIKISKTSGLQVLYPPKTIVNSAPKSMLFRTQPSRTRKYVILLKWQMFETKVGSRCKLWCCTWILQGYLALSRQ